MSKDPNRYGHFTVEKDGEVTVVTNTDDKPHDMTYYGETITLEAGEVRRFSPPPSTS